MKSVKIFLLLAPLLFTFGCGSSEDQTTSSDLTIEEVDHLKRAAATGDLQALRELETYYDLEQMDDEREAAHRRMAELGDADALLKDAMTAGMQAEQIADKQKRREALEIALDIAKEAAIKKGYADPNKNLTVQYIEREINKTL